MQIWYGQVFVVLSIAVIDCCLAYESTVYDEGQKQYEAIVADSRHPKYGACWTRVLEDVKQGCRKLTEDTQHRLALGFTNCFLAKTGRQTYSGCESEVEEISKCVSTMDSAAFTAYTNFFTHAQSLCYFLESIRWQENAELTIGRLITQTLHFEQRLKDWNHSVLSFENRTMGIQNHLIEAGSRLSSTLDQSQAAVALMRQSSADQHEIIRDVFKQLTSLQEMVVDEFAGFYAYAYYVASTGLAYVLTSTSRTDAARVPLLAVTSSTFAVERFLLRQVLTFCLSIQGHELTNTTMHVAIWWLRRAAVFICLVLLAWSTVRFRDLHAINHSLLEGVAREQRHLRRIYSHIALLRDAIRERSLTPRGDASRHNRHHSHRTRPSSPASNTVTSATGDHSTPTTARSNSGATSVTVEAKINEKLSPADADDEGDGGNNDDNVSLAGSIASVASTLRYNLRSHDRSIGSPSTKDATLRELTPVSTLSSVRSRSRSRSRSRVPSGTPSSAKRSTNRQTPSATETDVQLYASVEAAARRTARTARMARLAAQREEGPAL